MTLEATVRALLDDAAPLLRRAIHDNALDILVNTVRLSIRDLLQRAYEVGYREGLAARPGAEATALARTPSAGSNGGAGDEVIVVDDIDWEDDFEPEGEPPPVAETATPPAAHADEALGSTPTNGTPAGLDWGTPDEGERTGRSARTRPTTSLRIFPHATIGTLRERIIETFGLERFDIEVILTRPGDKTRRQLKGSVKLSKYLVEGEGK